MRFITLLFVILTTSVHSKEPEKFLFENDQIGIRLPLESERLIVTTPEGQKVDVNLTPTRQFIMGLSQEFRAKHKLDTFISSPNVLDQVFSVINKKNGKFMYWIALERSEDLPLFLSGYLYLSFFQDGKETKEEDESVLMNLPTLYTFFNGYVKNYIGKSLNEHKYPFYNTLYKGMRKNEFLSLFSKESQESKVLAAQYYDGLLALLTENTQHEETQGIPGDVFIQGILVSSFDTTQLHKTVHQSLIQLGLHPVGVSKTMGVLFANNLDESMRDKRLEDLVEK